MNKSDLIRQLAKKTGLSAASARETVDALFAPEDGIIAETLRRGDRIQISGFGRFEVRHRKARTGRHPQTGVQIQIGSTSRPVFSPGKALREGKGPGARRGSSAGRRRAGGAEAGGGADSDYGVPMAPPAPLLQDTHGGGGGIFD